jgi:hypothetical protein
MESIHAPASDSNSGNARLIIFTIKISRRENSHSHSHSHLCCLSLIEWIILLLFTVGQFTHAMIGNRIPARHRQLPFATALQGFPQSQDETIK